MSNHANGLLRKFLSFQPLLATALGLMFLSCRAVPFGFALVPVGDGQYQISVTPGETNPLPVTVEVGNETSRHNSTLPQESAVEPSRSVAADLPKLLPPLNVTPICLLCRGSESDTYGHGTLLRIVDESDTESVKCIFLTAAHVVRDHGESLVLGCWGRMYTQQFELEIVEIAPERDLAVLVAHIDRIELRGAIGTYERESELAIAQALEARPLMFPGIPFANPSPPTVLGTRAVLPVEGGASYLGVFSFTRFPAPAEGFSGSPVVQADEDGNQYLVGVISAVIENENPTRIFASSVYEWVPRALTRACR